MSSAEVEENVWDFRETEHANMVIEQPASPLSLSLLSGGLGRVGQGSCVSVRNG